MRLPKYRKAYQPTVYRYENGRAVDSLEFPTLFATSAEARMFATNCWGYRSGRFNTCIVATRHVTTRKFASVIATSITRPAA